MRNLPLKYLSVWLYSLSYSTTKDNNLHDQVTAVYIMLINIYIHCTFIRL